MDNDRLSELEQQLAAAEAANAVLRQSEESYRTVFESIDEGFAEVDLITDKEGRVVDWRYLKLNPAFTRMTGMPDVAGLLISEILPDLEPEWGEHYTQLLASGEPVRFEEFAESIGMWFDVYAALVGGPGSRRAMLVYNNITARKKAEAALRNSEERQAFLLQLSDALRSIADPREVQRVATRLLGERLGASRVFYVLVEADGETGVIDSNYTKDVPERLGSYSLSAFSSSAAEQWRAGRIATTDDVDADPRYSEADRAAYASISTRAGVGVPLIKGGRLAALLGVNQATPRQWTEQDIELTREVAERTWAAVERARAETALQESETLRRVALAGGRMGAWRWDLDAALIWGDAQFWKLWGYPPSDDPRPLSDFNDRMSPQSIDDVAAVVASAIKAGDQFDGPLEIVNGPTAGHWLRWQGRAENDNAALFYGVTFDITEQKRAETALRDSEDRQAFLLKLSDALGPLSDPADIQDAAARVIGEHLGADRAYYAYVEGDFEFAVIEREYIRGDAPSVVGRHKFSDFDAVRRAYLTGKNLVLDDVDAPGASSKQDLAAYRAISVKSYLGVLLIKEGKAVASFNALVKEPHHWTPQQVALMEETAERTWAAVERARAEEALCESEERFAQFGRASSDGLWVRDAATLALEYASDAMETIYGISREKMAADPMAWPALIVPEDRDETFDYIERVKAGESIVHEFRIQRPSDLEFRWIRSVGFPLFDNGHGVTRIAGISSDITEERMLTEHQGVLLAELQHRVRNIMAIIRSIVARTADSAGGLADYVELLSGRLLTLARVQALLTRSVCARVGLSAIVQDELAAQAAHAGQFDIEGPDVVLSPKAAETMTLAVHELTTNALKYGALASTEGKVTVRWRAVERRGATWLAFDWYESGAPIREKSSAPGRVGFGSELIEGRVPYELGGRGSLTIDADGAHCIIEFPLKEGASVLETDAPRRATLFGGTIDMSGQADLTSQRVLVVEDDYYLASDAARALKGAGAEVLGPCPTEAAAREELGDSPATCAVLDINLNGGRSFDLARELKSDGVPFVFITGYDQDVIPDDLANVRRLQKPVQFREIISALADALAIDDRT